MVLRITPRRRFKYLSFTGGRSHFSNWNGLFGCRDENGQFSDEEFQKEACRDEVKMIEIKLSQGAKPSHGGILPAAKVTEEIAKVRKVVIGHDIISPMAHSTFDSPRGLLLFVDRLRTLSGGKPVGFKLCLGRKDQFFGICKAMLETEIYPDFITVDGAEGGTGAAPLEYANYIGEPLEYGLVFVHNALVGINLRSEIKIACAGKIATGFDLVEKIALGADICNSARAMMMAIGCVQSKQCNANTCPTGVATQNLRLQRGLVVAEKKYRVANYHKNTIKSFLEIVGAMGLTNPTELSPEHIIRRISPECERPFSQIHEFLEPGALLRRTIPKLYQKDWYKASALSF